MSTLPPGHQSPSYWVSLLTLSLTLMSFMAELLLWPRVRQSKAEICVLLFGPRMPTHRPTSRQQGLKSTESWSWKKRGRNAHRRRNHRVEKLSQSWHRTNLHVYRLRYNRFRKWLTLLLSLFFLCMRQTLQKKKNNRKTCLDFTKLTLTEVIPLQFFWFGVNIKQNVIYIFLCISD